MVQFTDNFDVMAEEAVKEKGTVLGPHATASEEIVSKSPLLEEGEITNEDGELSDVRLAHHLK